MTSHSALLREARERDSSRAEEKEVVLYPAGSPCVETVTPRNSTGWSYK